MDKKRANLYCQTAFLGDLFLSIPSLKHLKKKGTPLILCCRKGLGDIFKKLDLVDDFVEVDKSDLSTWKNVVDNLRDYEFENIFSPHQSFRTAWHLKKVKAKNKIGFYCWWNFWVFNKRVHRPMSLPEPLRQLFLVATMDETLKNTFHLESSLFVNSDSHLTMNYINSEPIPSWASMSVRDRVEKWVLPVKERYIFLAPGSVWKTKRWGQYAQLAKVLISAGESVALIGSPDEVEIGKEIQSQTPEVHNFIGRWSLDELLSALSHGKYLVANDSGAIHMAVAVELPTVSVFGPTTLSLGYRPWINSSVVVQKKLSCRPCGKHGARVCPIGTHECMKSLSTQLVLDSISDLLPASETDQL